MKFFFMFTSLILVFVSFAFDGGTLHAYNQSGFLNLGNTTTLEGVLPPPGIYLSLYSVYYNGDDFNDGDGDSLPGSNTLDYVAIAPQIIYVHSKKIFGLTPGFQVLPGLISLDVDSDLGIDSGRSGFTDLVVGPFVGSNFKPTKNSTLYWNFEFDTYFPIGRYDNDYAVNPGANFYTFEPWVNFTLLLPYGFEISSRIHYTFNTENDDYGVNSLDMEAGDAFHLNYSVTKTCFNENFRIGVVGYYLKQLDEDKIEGRNVPDSEEQVFAIGPTAVLIHNHTFFQLSAMFETHASHIATKF